ncbi:MULTISPECIES: hypothetical protein [Brevibacillus]|uniref:hypothetical protein n=1 Tax=Brevibacillus TaxID=55080 RepID=UPI003640687A
MQRSFFTSRAGSTAQKIIVALNAIRVCYTLEMHTSGVNRFVFPDVNISIYSQLRKLFGGNGAPYK